MKYSSENYTYIYTYNSVQENYRLYMGSEPMPICPCSRQQCPCICSDKDQVEPTIKHEGGLRFGTVKSEAREMYSCFSSHINNNNNYYYITFILYQNQ